MESIRSEDVSGYIPPRDTGGQYRAFVNVCQLLSSQNFWVYAVFRNQKQDAHLRNIFSKFQYFTIVQPFMPFLTFKPSMKNPVQQKIEAKNGGTPKRCGARREMSDIGEHKLSSASPVGTTVLS